MIGEEGKRGKDKGKILYFSFVTECRNRGRMNLGSVRIVQQAL